MAKWVEQKARLEEAEAKLKELPRERRFTKRGKSLRMILLKSFQDGQEYLWEDDESDTEKCSAGDESEGQKAENLAPC